MRYDLMRGIMSPRCNKRTAWEWSIRRVKTVKISLRIDGLLLKIEWQCFVVPTAKRKHPVSLTQARSLTRATSFHLLLAQHQPWIDYAPKHQPIAPSWLRSIVLSRSFNLCRPDKWSTANKFIVFDVEIDKFGLLMRLFRDPDISEQRTSTWTT